MTYSSQAISHPGGQEQPSALAYDAVVGIADTRSYEHFLGPQSRGFGRLGSIGTVVMFVSAVLAVFIIKTLGLIWGAAFGAVAALVLLGLVKRDVHGQSVLERIGLRIAFRHGESLGANQYASGPLSRLGRYQLPGVLAQTELTEWEDANGLPFALVYTPSANHYAVTIAAHPDGASLHDRVDLHAAVDRWGDWLAFLGSEPGCLQVMVTQETAPDTGQRFRQALTDRTVPGCADLAANVVREIAETYPAGSATIASWVTLTFTGRHRKGRRRADEMGKMLASRLPELVGELEKSGAGYCAPVDAQTITETVRVAYDPGCADDITASILEDRRIVMRWDSIGPVAADARWEYYRHASGVSVSWSMSDIQGAVRDESLAPLLRPHPAIARKRVSLVFKLRDPGEAPHVAASDVSATEWKLNTNKRPSSRARKAARTAAMTAEHEAHGAGLVDVSVLVTATVGSVDELADAEAAVDILGPTARLLLRREDGCQAAAFASNLPGIGLITSAHVRVPAALRESL